MNEYMLSSFFVVMVAGEDGEITTAHLLLGIWSEKESAGHKILASLGFDDEKASELAKSVSVYLACLLRRCNRIFGFNNIWFTFRLIRISS